MTARLLFYIRGVALSNPLNDSIPNSKTHAIIIRAKHAKERKTALAATRAALRLARVHPADLLPAKVMLKRISLGKLDEGDGLNASCKWVRDAVAEALGVNDGGPFVRWEYGQRKGKRGQRGVIVRIERDEARRGS